MSESAGNALISVYDKTGVVDLAAGLVDLDYNVISSGGTAKAIGEADIPVTEVADITGWGSMLDGRVKTLHPLIHGGILADTRNPKHMETVREKGISIFDIVCVDMYPLEEEIAKPGVTMAEIIEKIDVGGPTMLNGAAKSRKIVLSVAEQRPRVLQWLQDGKPNEEEFLDDLVAQSFYETTRYYMPLTKLLGGTSVSGFIAKLDSPTKYGENPQQADAGFYADNRVDVDPLGVDQFEHVQGMERSYVNMTDIDRLLQTSTHIAAGFERNFGEVPHMAVGVKHGNACGAGVGETLVDAVEKMLEGDTRAIFGGVVMLNGEIDKEVAETLMKYAMDGDMSRLLDGVIGSSVTDEALELLSRKKLRVITNPALGDLNEGSLDSSRRVRPIRGGALEQPNYDFVQDLAAENMQQYGELTEQQRQDMILAWAVGSTSNSNTITLVKNGQLIGNGVGQQDRVGAGQLAISRTTIELPEIEDKGDKLELRVILDKHKLEGAVAYSDSFFPFPDGPELLVKAGVKAILTSSGSIKDDDVIKTLTDAGASIMMVPDKAGRGFYTH